MQEYDFYEKKSFSVNSQNQFRLTMYVFLKMVESRVFINFHVFHIIFGKYIVINICLVVFEAHSVPAHNNTTCSVTACINVGIFNHHPNWKFRITTLTTFSWFYEENVFPLIIKRSFMLNIAVIKYNKFNHLRACKYCRSHLHGLEPENI